MILMPCSRTVVWVAASGLAAIVVTAVTFGDSHHIFLATGLWALVLMLIPVALAAKAGGRYDWFSIWSFVALTVVLGVTIRGACLTFGYPDRDRLDELYFLGQEPAFFVKPAFLLLAGLSMLTLGYLAPISAACPAGEWRTDPRRLRAVCLALLAISILATLLYINRTGGWESGDWTAKRTPIPDSDLAGTRYQSHGGLRFLASLAIFGHVLAMAGRLRVLAVVLLVVACVVPFYASLRTTVALQLCLPVAMLYYAGRRPIFFPAIVISSLLALTVYVMTVLRPADGKLAAPTLTRVFDAAVLNRNQIDLPKTAHISHAVPGELPFTWGSTITRWALAPIPRSLWPDKPVIPPGPAIGRAIYDQPVAGVPPSLVAEWYWNAHWPGVLIGSFSLGMLFRWLQLRFQAIRGGDPMRAALFVAGPMMIGFEAVGSSIGSGLFRAALSTLVMTFLLFLVKERPRPC
jgi:hypothetical protein